MTQLKDKVKNTLDEGRILIIGAQVLLGFHFRAVLESGFEHLSQPSKYLALGGLGLMLLAVALLIWPGAFHQIVENGEDTDRVHEFATFVLGIAVLPFALGLGVDFTLAADFLFGHTPGLIAGAAALLVAIGFWYVLEAIQRRKYAREIKEQQRMSKQKEKGGTELRDKIEQVLTELRVALPGAQALLGFQFTALFQNGFQKLSQSMKLIHFISLSFVGLAIILLMTPAAYHRIVERGEHTERFHRFASRILLFALVPLALGMTGDFYLIARKITDSRAMSIGMAVAAILIFYGLWFGFTLSKRRSEKPARKLRVSVSSAR